MYHAIWDDYGNQPSQVFETESEAIDFLKTIVGQDGITLLGIVDSNGDKFRLFPTYKNKRNGLTDAQNKASHRERMWGAFYTHEDIQKRDNGK